MLVSSEEQKRRIAICNRCPNLFTPTRSCKICKCFVDIKTKLQNQKCPIAKW